MAPARMTAITGLMAHKGPPSLAALGERKIRLHFVFIPGQSRGSIEIGRRCGVVAGEPLGGTAIIDRAPGIRPQFDRGITGFNGLGIFAGRRKGVAQIAQPATSTLAKRIERNIGNSMSEQRSF